MTIIKKTTLSFLTCLSLQCLPWTGRALAQVRPTPQVLAGKTQSFDLEIPQRSESNTKELSSSLELQKPLPGSQAHSEAEEYGEFALTLLVIVAGVVLIVWFAQVMVDFLFNSLKENIKYE